MIRLIFHHRLWRVLENWWFKCFHTTTFLINSSLRLHFYVRLLRVLMKISEPLISHVAVWKQLVNQWFVKEYQKNCVGSAHYETY
jgi:hypothetical protein